MANLAHRQMLGWPYPASFLSDDNFTTDLDADSVHGTAAEPGPGTRTVVDTIGKLSIVNGKLTIAAGPSTNADPGIWFNAVSRVAGRMFTAKTNFSSFGSETYPLQVGFNTVNSGYAGEATPTLNIDNVLMGTSKVVILTTSVDYIHYVLLRASGFYYLLKTATGNNILLYSLPTGASASLYPLIGSRGITLTSDFLRIPTTLWLPTPLLSDGFGGTWPTSDGLGHAEGVAGGIGSGGGGLTWTAALGTWGIAGGVASSSVLDASGISIAIATLPTADVHYSCVLAYSAGSAGVIVRYVDTANYTYAVNDGTNVKLFEVTTASPYPGTQRGTAVKAPAANARLIVDVSGAAVRVYYNETILYVYATLANTTAVKVGMITSNVNNTFNDAVAYSKGTGGEYNILDRYSRA